MPSKSDTWQAFRLIVRVHATVRCSLWNWVKPSQSTATISYWAVWTWTSINCSAGCWLSSSKTIGSCNHSGDWIHLLLATSSKMRPVVPYRLGSLRPQHDALHPLLMSRVSQQLCWQQAPADCCRIGQQSRLCGSESNVLS